MNGAGKRYILLVDDEEVVRNLIGRHLAILGYCAIAVASGAEAIAKVTNGTTTFDLVLLDMMMPGMSGEETFRTLHDLKPTLFFLLCSGSGESAATDRLLKTGSCELLGKPFKQAELRAKIEDLLARTPPPARPAALAPAAATVAGQQQASGST